MGCGVSKEDFAEPSRIQQVVVRDGSPTKAHEVAAQNAVNTTPVTQGNTDTVTVNPGTSPVSAAIVEVPPPPPAAPAIASPAAPPESPEHSVENETPVLPFPYETIDEGDPCTCTKSPEPKASSVAPVRTSNGLVGTLASLEEILNGQETVCINSKLKVTPDKLMSYGGVLRSLEDTVELQAAAEEEQHQNAESEPEEPEAEAEAEPEAEPQPQVPAESEGASMQSLGSPVENEREDTGSPAALPSLETAPKKLPPLETPLSFLIDKGPDPFLRAPLPMQLAKSLSTTTTHDIPVSPIDLTTRAQPAPPSPPHSMKTEVLMPEYIKDITVMNGAPGFDHEKFSSPKEWTSLEAAHSEDAELDNIILLETLGAGDCNDGDYASRVNHINHSIRVTSLTTDLGVSSNGKQSPFSTAE